MYRRMRRVNAGILLPGAPSSGILVARQNIQIHGV
jgi:hypothetical protein